MIDVTYKECWEFICPLLPINDEYQRAVYVMVFKALMDADKREELKNLLPDDEIDPKLIKATLCEYAPIEVLAEYIENQR